MIDKDSGKPPGTSEPTEARARLDELIADAVRGTVDSPAGNHVGQERDNRDAAECAAEQPGTEEHLHRLPAGRLGQLVERWVPASVAGRLLRPEGRGSRMLATVTVVAALVTGAVLLSTGPTVRRPAPRSPLPVAEPSVVSAVSETAPPSSAAADTVVVSVVGNVATPGLVTLSADARVADALRAAGGVTQRTDRRSVNLARHVVDGEQLYVGIPMPAGASQPPGRKAASSSGGRTVVNLNTAGMAELETLPGVGEVTARRIIEWRTSHDGFGAVEQLRQVDGIGDETLADLRPLVTVR